jgi:hypothetical protein
LDVAAALGPVRRTGVRSGESGRDLFIALNAPMGWSGH